MGRPGGDRAVKANPGADLSLSILLDLVDWLIDWLTGSSVGKPVGLLVD